MKSNHLGFNSKLIHAGHNEDQFGSAVVPIYQTSTFSFKSADHGAQCFAGESDGYIYTRIGNPTISALENALAQLENGIGGVATSSGMAATTTVYTAILSVGSHMIGHQAMYGPARVVIEKIYSKFGVESSFLNTTDLEAVKNAIRPNTRLIYLETPANPTMEISDIVAISKIAKENNILVCVDNTFCSPYLQNPLDLGADIVLHSMTKFINGHSDIVGGIVIAREKELFANLRSTMVTMGCNMDPHQAFLAHRGLKTLAIRMDRSQENALKVATYLEKHPKVEWVKFPGLKSHPQYELGVNQMRGFGATLSFEVIGGLKSGKIVMDNVKLFTLAVSLGGVESLIQHPASMTHSKMPKQSLIESGITEGLVRISVGIEDVEDLLQDLEEALAKV